MTDPMRTSVEAIAAAATEFLLDGPNGDDPVLQFLSPDELAAAFGEVIPLELGDNVPSRSTDELRSAVDLVIRHSVQTSHPRFFNQNFAGPDPIAVVGDWLGAALNTTSATFEAAPVFTLMEGAVLRKLAAVAGIVHDDEFGGAPPGMFAPGGSTATLYAMQLARHRRQPNMVNEGAGPERLVLFVSEAGHYAAVKSAALLGLGRNAVIEVDTDEVGVMNVEDLRRAVEQARDDGATPFMVIATAGTTVTSAFDPIDAIADVCEAEDLWMHVDGCYGGSALFSSAERHRLAGVERADSFVWNLHKMMGATQQCTALLLAEPEQLGPCFATGADYIFQPDKLYGEFDSGDKHFQCARRVDSLKLWLLWQARGDAGFEERINHSVAMANRVRQLVEESNGEFAFVVRGDFTNVTFLWVPPELRPFDLDVLADADLAALHALPPVMKSKMQAEGTSLLGFQPVNGINCLRWLFMNDAVQNEDVDAVFAHLRRYGREAWEQR